MQDFRFVFKQEDNKQSNARVLLHVCLSISTSIAHGNSTEEAYGSHAPEIVMHTCAINATPS